MGNLGHVPLHFFWGEEKVLLGGKVPLVNEKMPLLKKGTFVGKKKGHFFLKQSVFGITTEQAGHFS